MFNQVALDLCSLISEFIPPVKISVACIFFKPWELISLKMISSFNSNPATFLSGVAIPAINPKSPVLQFEFAYPVLPDSSKKK